MPAGLEAAPQLPEVVDLAIEDHSQRAVFIEYRLMPSPEVDNAEATHSQHHRLVLEEAVVIRTPMDHPRHHLADRRLSSLGFVGTYDATNSAHTNRLSSRDVAGTSLNCKYIRVANGHEPRPPMRSWHGSTYLLSAHAMPSGPEPVAMRSVTSSVFKSITAT